MVTTQWVIDQSDINTVYELRGRKFGSGDEGGPLLCNLVCADQGRHPHIDYCRQLNHCEGPEHQHIMEQISPNPERAKDWISHRLKWARSGR